MIIKVYMLLKMSMKILLQIAPGNATSKILQLELSDPKGSNN